MNRKFVAALILAGLVAAGLISCESFKKGYDESFIKSWKESFVKSCAKDDDSQEQKDICQCVADKAVEQMTVEQLHEVDYSINYIKEHILPECQQGSQ